MEDVTKELEEKILEGLDSSVAKMIERYEEMSGVLLSEKERDAMHYILHQAMSHGASVYARIQLLKEVFAPEPEISVIVMGEGNKRAEELERLIRETRKHQKDPNIPANPKHRKPEHQ